MAKRKRQSFTLVMHGDLSVGKDSLNVFPLAGMTIRVGLDLEDAVRNRATFDEAARIIGQYVMEHGVRYAARGARKWRMT